MKTLNILFVAIALVFGTAVFGQVDQLGARPLGTGGAYTALTRDANAPVWNPAAMESFRNLSFTASYARLYLGVENDGLNEGFAGFVNHLGLYGEYGSYGISFAQYFSDVYSQMHVTVGYAKRLYGKANGPHLAIGANAKLIRSSFNDANFEGFDLGDPVFSNGYDKMAYSADAGLIFRPTDWLSIGATAKDILQPDISISGSGTDADKLPMTIRGGLALHYKGFNPVVDVEFKTKNINGASDMKIHAGLEKWFGKSFAIRGGLNRSEAALGLSYQHLGERFGWGFDYAALYPVMTEMASQYFTTHRVAFNMMLEPPPPPIRDLELVDAKVVITPLRSVIGNDVDVRATVENRGEIAENGVRVAVYYKDDAGEWHLAVPVERHDFEVAQRAELSWKWSPPAKGHYTMFVSVDDKGDRIPEVNGKIKEENEENNTGSGEFDVFMTPEGTIEPRDNILTVSKLTVYQEEEPIVPAVFFDKGNTGIDPRFDEMLKTVATRLKDNPDVLVFVRGYYDSLTDPKDNPEALAAARGRAVGDKLKAFGAPAGQVSVVETGYFTGKSRAGNVDVQLNIHDADMMKQENRRAEISAWFPQGTDFVAEIPMTGKTLGTDATNVIGGHIGRMKALMDNNSEVIIIAESYFNKKDQASEDLAFAKAAAVGKYLRNQLGEEYADRIRINTSFESEADQEQVLIFPNSESVIWRPKLGERIFTAYEAEGSEDNLVQIEANVDAGVDSFGVVIVDETGKVVRFIAAGKGEIPTGLAWDWKDNSGELLDFDHKYFCRLDIKDNMGENFLTYSDTMEIQISRQAKRIESLVIVVFEFNEEIPSSKFLETRIEYVARRFIDRAERSSDVINALVAGHTDSIGSEDANIALSEKRAARELQNLRRYMIYLLDLESQAQLDKWLTDHKIVLKAKGFWESQPYEILRWTGNTVERVLLGDNKRPEGRIVNRRVLLMLESEKLGK